MTDNSKKKLSAKGEIVYLAESLSILKDGMTVTSDIYAANRAILLIPAGTILDSKKIEALHRVNNYDDVINIAFESHAKMLEYKLSCKINNADELEEATGYTEVKDMAAELLAELEDMEIIEHDKAGEMSEELCDRLENTNQDVILDLINSLSPIDEYLPRHCIEVGMLCGLLGRWLGYPKDEVDNLVTIGLLHDCGKASTPGKILSAPRKLSTAEYEVVKMHAVYSYEMLQNLPADIRCSVRSHHERNSGSGYPDGLKDSEIPMKSKIVAVCDTYDAMVSRRSYKNGHNPFLIIKTLRGLSGTELDSTLVDIFTANMLNEFIEKPVMLSNGEVAVVHELNPEDIEFPFVRTINGIVKTGKDLQCVSMYYEDRNIIPLSE